MPDDSDSKPDKYEARLTQSIENLRGNVKWTLVAFGAIGTILLAGSQLSSIGKFPIDEPRLWGAIFFAAVALIAAVCAVGSALNAINTGYVEFDHLDRDDIDFVQRNPAMLEGFATYENLKAWYHNCIDERFQIISSPNFDPENFANNATWFKYLDSLVDAILSYVQYNRVKKQAETSRGQLMWTSGIAAVALLGFAWAANPKTEQSVVVLTSPAAQAALVLTIDGKKALSPVLGAKCVLLDRIDVIVLNVATTGTDVVGLRTKDCQPARFTVTETLGKISAPSP